MKKYCNVCKEKTKTNSWICSDRDDLDYGYEEHFCNECGFNGL